MRAEDATFVRLARSSGFCRRCRKLTPVDFVQSCILQVLQATVSLRHHAALLGLLQGGTLSKQALHQRLKVSLGFLQACLTHWLARPLAKDLGPLRTGSFARVLLHDSSCVALNSTHTATFLGPSNQSASTQAALRVQVLYDLLAERSVQFHLTAFTRNDQAASADVLPFLQTDDLLVRDLGYFSLDVFVRLAATGAYFLSRWRFGVQLRDPATGRPIALPARLRPGISLVLPVVLSNGLQVRLLALPLSPAIAAARRRQARANRDRRLRHNDDYYYLLGWTLLLTNASPARLPLFLASSVYRLRWRIEIIFKSWKSHLGLLHTSRCGQAQLLPLILAMLLFALCVHALLPAAPLSSPNFSLLKLTSLFAVFLLPACLCPLSPTKLAARFTAQLPYHGCYEKRPRLDYFKLKLSTLS